MPFFVIERYSYAKPSVCQFGIYFDRFFIIRSGLIHSIQLLIAFSNSTISLGTWRFIFKRLLIDVNRFTVLFEVNERVAFIEISRCKIVFDQNGIIIGVDRFLVAIQFMICISKVVPGCTGVGIVVNILLIKSDTFL